MFMKVNRLSVKKQKLGENISSATCEKSKISRYLSACPLEWNVAQGQKCLTIVRTWQNIPVIFNGYTNSIMKDNNTGELIAGRRAIVAMMKILTILWKLLCIGKNFFIIKQQERERNLHKYH